MITIAPVDENLGHFFFFPNVIMSKMRSPGSNHKKQFYLVS